MSPPNVTSPHALPGAYATGINETWKDALIPTGTLTSSQQRAFDAIPHEDVCHSGRYMMAVHRLQATTNFTSYRATCAAAMNQLRFGGAKFGPPSPWEVFQQVCRTCSQYTALLKTLKGVGGCDCSKFTFGPCPNLSPTDMLCELFQECYDADYYFTQYCATNVSCSWLCAVWHERVAQMGAVFDLVSPHTGSRRASVGAQCRWSLLLQRKSPL